MDYVIYYLQILLYSLGAMVVCGLAVWACQRLFIHLMGGGVGYKIVLGTSIIGTPVHEIGHALMCLVFGHRISKIVLWQPRSEDGTLGYVAHTWNGRNLFHNLGNIFIGVGPIFSGVIVISLCLYYGFPGTFAAYVAGAESLVNSGAGVQAFLLEGIEIIPNLIGEFTNESFPIWGRILLIIAMLCVSLHINLSPADIKGSLSGIPVYLGLTLVLTITSHLAGTSAMADVLDTLKLYNGYMMAMFTLVFVFSVVQVLVALMVWLLRKIF